MPGPDTALEANTAPEPENDLAADIAASLASVSARFAGARPSGCAVEVDGSVIRWTLPDGLVEVPAGDQAPEGRLDAAPLTLSGFSPGHLGRRLEDHPPTRIRPDQQGGSQHRGRHPDPHHRGDHQEVLTLPEPRGRRASATALESVLRRGVEQSGSSPGS
jgi:hypothetical protein